MTQTEIQESVAIAKRWRTEGRIAITSKPVPETQNSTNVELTIQHPTPATAGKSFIEWMNLYLQQQKAFTLREFQEWLARHEVHLARATMQTYLTAARNLGLVNRRQHGIFCLYLKP